MRPSSDITQLLRDWSNGDQAALDKLTPLIYEELHRMAGGYMSRQDPASTLQTTAIIHEAYLRLVNQKDKQWQSRSHFFAVAATAMRQILVDYARSRSYAKRGGGASKVSLEEAAFVSEERAAEVVALNDALEELAKIDQRKGRIVEMRFFSGLSVEETAEVLNVSPITVMRDWSLAKAWLYRELSKTEMSDE